MEQRTTIGIDLAKEVFAICVLSPGGAVVESRTMRRAAFERWLVGLQGELVVAMEACSSAHHWGRRLAAAGHTVRLMAPAFVVPFRKSGKNDANDAEAIAVAARQPTMRFVAVKTVEQQSILSWHRAREGWIAERTALINRLRGLLTEFGFSIAQSAFRLRKALPALSTDAAVPAPIRALLLEAGEQLRCLDARVTCCDEQIAAHGRDNDTARRLRGVLGIGPLTSSALVATVPDAAAFHNSRQFGAWIGLVPRQHSSGGKPHLGELTRRGDKYLRSLLVQGARSALQVALRVAPDKATRLQRWILALYSRKGYHRTLVAVANKHARIIWALMARGEHFDNNAWQRHPLQRAAAA
jgi:transposase